jgi:glycerol 3-phosphatase-2
VLLLVDLDGVVYRGAQPVPGMPQLLARRAARGDRIMYVTNNSRWHRDEYRARLEALHVPLGPNGEESIVSAARATALTLAEARPPVGTAMVLGGAGLARELRDAGIHVVAPNQRGLAARPDVVVVGVDFSLRYDRLSAAAAAVRDGARFIATNRDPVYPTPSGLSAGAGSIVAAVAVAGRREPDLVVGKPQPRLFETAARLAGGRPADAIVVGDSLGTDIAAAIAIGARSVLMLTGVTSAADLRRVPAAARPTAVAADAAELEKVLERFAGETRQQPAG